MEKITKTIETTKENAEAAERKAWEWGADYSRLHARIDEFLAVTDKDLAFELFLLIKKSKSEVIEVPQMSEEELVRAVESLQRRIRSIEYIDLDLEEDEQILNHKSN